MLLGFLFRFWWFMQALNPNNNLWISIKITEFNVLIRKVKDITFFYIYIFVSMHWTNLLTSSFFHFICFWFFFIFLCPMFDGKFWDVRGLKGCPFKAITGTSTICLNWSRYPFLKIVYNSFLLPNGNEPSMIPLSEWIFCQHWIGPSLPLKLFSRLVAFSDKFFFSGGRMWWEPKIETFMFDDSKRCFHPCSTDSPKTNIHTYIYSIKADLLTHMCTHS